jgi:hypothetical protein
LCKHEFISNYSSSRDRDADDIAPLADALVGLEVDGFFNAKTQRCEGANVLTLFNGDLEQLRLRSASVPRSAIEFRAANLASLPLGALALNSTLENRRVMPGSDGRRLI